jgi:hypothetical protein
VIFFANCFSIAVYVDTYLEPRRMKYVFQRALLHAHGVLIVAITFCVIYNNL